MYYPFEKKILKRADKIIATSQIYAENSDSLSMYLEKVSIIPNIVCTKFLDDLSENDKKQISAIREKFNNKKLVFFIGVHREYKGLQYLVDAAKYLTTDYVVLIAGKGPLTDELKQKVLELS